MVRQENQSTPEQSRVPRMASRAESNPGHTGVRKARAFISAPSLHNDCNTIKLHVITAIAIHCSVAYLFCFQLLRGLIKRSQAKMVMT